MAEKTPETRSEPLRTVSVVVRFYRGISPKPEEWRGQVEPVQSNEKRSFHGAQELLQIIQSLSAYAREEKNQNPKEGLR
ncbi:hypothetical protein HYR54_00020 [Candidatus Acetothermia bacterium]|nr:hypothetical protein [Candidatus Acetothermia bacterium]